MKNRFEVVDLLLKLGVKINKNISLYPVLYHVCYFGLAKMGDILINNGADMYDTLSCVPLFYDICSNGHYDSMLMLLKNGYDVNTVTSDNRIALHTAACYGHLKIVKLLLQYGANLNHRDKKQTTPIHLACWNGHIDTVKFLIECGADINICKKNYGNIALVNACIRDNYSMISLLIKNGSLPIFYDPYTSYIHKVLPYCKIRTLFNLCIAYVRANKNKISLEHINCLPYDMRKHFINLHIG